MKQENTIVELLSKNNMRVSFAESCTGGAVTSAIVGVPGASGVLDMSVVVYANDAKIAYTDVTMYILEKYGAVSEQAAAAMASGIRRESGADIGVGITGIAGPDGGTPEKPIGLVYAAVSSEKKNAVKRFLIEKTDRNEIRFEAVRLTLELLNEFLTED